MWLNEKKEKDGVIWVSPLHGSFISCTNLSSPLDEVFFPSTNRTMDCGGRGVRRKQGLRNTVILVDCWCETVSYEIKGYASDLKLQQYRLREKLNAVGRLQPICPTSSWKNIDAGQFPADHGGFVWLYTTRRSLRHAVVSIFALSNR